MNGNSVRLLLVERFCENRPLIVNEDNTASTKRTVLIMRTESSPMGVLYVLLSCRSPPKSNNCHCSRAPGNQCRSAQKLNSSVCCPFLKRICRNFVFVQRKVSLLSLWQQTRLHSTGYRELRTLEGRNYCQTDETGKQHAKWVKFLPAVTPKTLLTLLTRNFLIIPVLRPPGITAERR